MSTKICISQRITVGRKGVSLDRGETMIQPKMARAPRHFISNVNARTFNGEIVEKSRMRPNYSRPHVPSLLQEGDYGQIIWTTSRHHKMSYLAVEWAIDFHSQPD